MNDEKPPPDDQESTVTAPSPSVTPGRIGPYKILQKLGEGGMGVVYLAEQEHPIRRRVALKITHGQPHPDPRGVLRPCDLQPAQRCVDLMERWGKPGATLPLAVSCGEGRTMSGGYTKQLPERLRTSDSQPQRQAGLHDQAIDSDVPLPVK